jgi:AsmA protein
MKKVLAIAAIAIGAIALLLALGIVLLVLLVDPNDYKDDISRAVHQATGRELTFGGDISFTFYPWLGLELGPVALSNAPGFDRDAFARVSQAKVDIKLLPLLRREVQTDAVLLDGLALHLERDKQGRTNWEDLLPKEGQEPAPATPTDQPATIRDLTIGGIAIRNSMVTWDDRSAGQSFELGNVEMKTSEIRFGELFSFSLGFDFASTSPKLSTRTTANGQAMLDPQGQRYSARSLEVRSTVRGEGIPERGVAVDLTTHAEADLQAGTLNLTEISIRAMDQLSIMGQLQARDLNAKPAYQGTFKLARSNPREIMRALGIDPPVTRDPAALTLFSAEASFSGSTTSAALEKLQVILDQTTLSGTAAIPTFEPQSFRFDLTADTLDADRYLPPPAPEGQPAPAQTKPAQTKVDDDPLKALRDLRLAGQMTLGTLKLMNLTTTDVRVGINARDGVMTVDPFGMTLYGGSAAGRVRLDARKPVPTWSATEKLSQVQIGPLVRDFMGKDLISGTANIEIDISAAGIDGERIKRSLDGRVALRANDGAVKGVNVARLIRDARAKLAGQFDQSAAAEQQTDFSELAATLTIDDGLIKNDDLAMKSPLLRVSGKGTVNLPQEQVDYLITAAIVGTLEGQGGAAAGELRDIPVPIRIRGTFDNLSYTPDLETLGKRLLQEKGTQELKKRLERDIGEKLKDVPFLGGGGQQGTEQNGTAAQPPSIFDLFKKK